MFLLSWMAVGFLLQVSPTSSRLRETEEGTEQNQVSQQEKKNNTSWTFEDYVVPTYLEFVHVL